MSDSPPGMAARRFRRTLVFAAAACWIVFLAALALWTANPVTLNRDQILIARSSGAVIIGQVLSTKLGQIKVEEVLTAADELPIEIAPGREITADSLADAGIQDGDRAVLPVVVRPSGEVSLVPTPSGTTRAYPATTEVVNAVKQLIAAK